MKSDCIKSKSDTITHCHVRVHECVYTFIGQTMNEMKKNTKKKHRILEKEEANVIKLAHPFRLCSLFTYTHTQTLVLSLSLSLCYIHFYSRINDIDTRLLYSAATTSNCPKKHTYNTHTL